MAKIFLAIFLMYMPGFNCTVIEPIKTTREMPEVTELPNHKK